MSDPLAKWLGIGRKRRKALTKSASAERLLRKMRKEDLLKAAEKARQKAEAATTAAARENAMREYVRLTAEADRIRLNRRPAKGAA